MADLVLLTGISGFLGGHLALALLRAGYRVRGSLRHMDRAASVRTMLVARKADIARLEFVELDLLADEGWREAMAGVRYLQHTASPLTAHMPGDRMELIRPAVEGTERALNAALAGEVERIVLTSSMAAIAYGHDPARRAPFTELDWTNLEGRRVNAYTESKTRAERRAWQIMRAAGRQADLAAINPSIILGGLLDDDPGTSALLIRRLLDGSLPALPRIAPAIVGVEDVVEAHLRAMTVQEAGGRRFPISARTLFLREVAAIVREAAGARGRRVPWLPVPDVAVRLLALLNRDIRGIASELGIVKKLDSRAVEALLGHRLRPAEDAITATTHSLIARGLV